MLASPACHAIWQKGEDGLDAVRFAQCAAHLGVAAATGLSIDISTSPSALMKIQIQIARPYPPVTSKMYPARNGPAAPPKVPLNATIPKRAP